MTKICTVLLGAGAMAMAQDAGPQPDQVMFDAGLRFEAQQKPEKARLLLRTLALTFPESPLTARANKELAALTLFFAAQSDLANGRTKRAQITLQTLLRTYPSSPLGPQAEAAIRAIR
jgi:hypothetical protein